MPQIIVGIIIIAVVIQILGELFKVIGKMLSALFLFSGWSLYTISALTDRLFGQWGNSPSISWGLVGLVMGSIMYFMLHESRKLSRPKLNACLLTVCTVFLISGPFIGDKISSRSKESRNALPQVDIKGALSTSTRVPERKPESKAVRRTNYEEPVRKRIEAEKRVAAETAETSSVDSSKSLFKKGEAFSNSDPKKAAQFFLNSAQKGYVKAQRKLGSLYYKGNGVAQDYSESARWYRKAAEKGDADSQFFYSYMLINGEGVAQSESEARKWLDKAARQGHPDAKKELALLGSNR